jgi:PAS domain S-box-containing protein
MMYGINIIYLLASTSLFGVFEAIVSTSVEFIMLLVLIASVVAVLFLVSVNRSLRKVLRSRDKEHLAMETEIARIKSDLENQRDKMAKELADTDKLHGILIEAADDSISFYDEDWNLVFANSAFYSVIGISREEYEAKNTEGLIHPDDKNFSVSRRKILAEEGVYNSQLRIRHRNGEYVTLSTKTVQIKSDTGDVIGSLTISRDISAVVHIHEELVKAKEEAEASNRLKTSFMANISHEIRTPLNSVVGFANLLLADNMTADTKEEYVEHINYNSEKLLQIIGDIIDLSRLESSQMEISYEEASISAIVREVADDTARLIKRQEKPILMSIRNSFEEISDLIFTDSVWLKRVLNHLMDNAVKFTLEGTVELSYSLEGSLLSFRVKDTGIGIKKENLETIFEEFRQEIDGHHRPFEGLGVGLTLVKEVVERMGGRVNVTSEKGMGSEFTLLLPYRPAGTIKVKQPKIDESELLKDWSSKRCLIVDDNRDVLTYLKRILLDTGIDVVAARSGPEALKIMEQDKTIDVVLLDMQMPEMNGIEVTREIRKIRGNIPIVAQTAFVFEDDKDIILEAGCDACLVKPIRKEQLIGVMGSFIRK